MLKIYAVIICAIVTANCISIALATWAMSNGGIIKWLMKRYEKMFEIVEEES